jgi:hypothetical protein
MQQNLQQVMAAMANLLPQFQNQASAAVARPPGGRRERQQLFPRGISTTLWYVCHDFSECLNTNTRHARSEKFSGGQWSHHPPSQ